MSRPVTLLYPCLPPSREPIVVLKLLASLRSLEANATPGSLGRLVVVTSEAERFRRALCDGFGVKVVEHPDVCVALARRGVKDPYKHWAILDNVFAGLAETEEEEPVQASSTDHVLISKGYDLADMPTWRRAGTLTMLQHSQRTDPASGAAVWKKSVELTAKMLDGSPGWDGRMYAVHGNMWVSGRQAAWIRGRLGWNRGVDAIARETPEGFEPWSLFAAADLAERKDVKLADFHDRKPGNLASLMLEMHRPVGDGMEFISYGPNDPGIPFYLLTRFPRPSRWERDGAVEWELEALAAQTALAVASRQGGKQ